MFLLCIANISKMLSHFLWCLTLASCACAHTIFQRVSVNGKDQGYLNGVRAPASNTPVTDVQDNSITCNTGLYTPVSTAVIDVPAGAQVGVLSHHILGGPQYPGDADDPIALSHKGPIQVYLAKVPDASNAETTGLRWFKIFSDGVDSSGKWGIDRMIANKGWANFTIPSCIESGDYLMRVEAIALHSASSLGGAQVYLSCANIKVSGGSGTNSGFNILNFPGAYTADDPGIHINIYDNNGQPTNGGRSYVAPGGSVLSCGGSGKTTYGNPGKSTSRTRMTTTTSSTPLAKDTSVTTSTTSSTSTTSTRTSSPVAPSESCSESGSVPLYGQCGKMMPFFTHTQMSLPLTTHYSHRWASIHG
ncbi:glycosyl hydrolase family 61-domain-containing protein [Cantharellus anzutake]|uniref:glycosyl hydrolase family 61-domain-containing protein n=1 Tax=Cantharellus anzutake TaxID=1750568 RepID=UPI0019081821|nr:glycosyl hydrolase family 61-domain-containing protein [Cantharellus anzutake]KAF8330075.1 glycosyl hydrolase family 61-domain-containing protein [Cantharellus anzutake]